MCHSIPFRMLVLLGVGLLFIVLANRFGAKPEMARQDVVLAPGYGSLAFTAPEAGTYSLPVLGKASNGQVIDSDGNEYSLTRLMRKKVVLLSFIFSTCSDINGCPLATSVLHRVKSRLNKEPQLADRVRLLTLSFNPEFDTPEVMEHYGDDFRDGELDWRFLTTRSEQQLQPILKNYNQSRQKEYDKNGRFTGVYSHILRVYLIDRQSRLRNIYSVSFLHPDTLVNDIKTLLMERSGRVAIQDSFDLKDTAQTKTHYLEPLYRGGDQKTGYESPEYKTQAIGLMERVGKPIDLLEFVIHPPLGLTTVPAPLDNLPTSEKIQLGRKLFYDRRLSLNNTVSCAMCHIPEQGFSSNEMATSVGIEGRTVKRNAPTLYNVAYAQWLFHDGRENTLEQQVWGPLLASNEMANPSVGAVIAKITNSADYDGLFEKAFNRGPGMETIGMAIASYERTLNSANSPFDHWYYGENAKAINDKAERGFHLFRGKAGCVNCHHIRKNDALFMDNRLHNTGVGYREAMLKEPSKHLVQVAPGVFFEIDAAAVNSVSERKPNDLGRYEVTQKPEDRWSYKTPSLRNIALTAPYMHNGSFLTLKQVVEFYNQGGVVNENLDPLIKPLTLTAMEVGDLVAFLNTLTGDNVATLVADAFAAPVGDMH